MVERTANPTSGFALRIEPMRGLTASDAASFERRLDDYLAAHGMQMQGGPLRCLVSSGSRELTETDQVDLLVWLLVSNLALQVHASPVSTTLHSPDDQAVMWLRADLCDVGLIGAQILYQVGRISPAMFIEILGGYAWSHGGERLQ